MPYIDLGLYGEETSSLNSQWKGVSQVYHYGGHGSKDFWPQEMNRLKVKAIYYELL